MKCFTVVVTSFLFITAPAIAQDLGPATDYDWELQTPGRALFRDRMLIGSVPLEQKRSRKTPLSKSKARTIAALALYSDFAFVPGDTVRYFAVDLVLTDKEKPLAFVILDLDELVPFQAALRYLAKTADNMRNSERTDTQILFRGKSDWQILFRQQGTQQQIEFHFPAMTSYEEQRRELQVSQVSALADLIDIALDNLKRQGVLIPETP